MFLSLLYYPLGSKRRRRRRRKTNQTKISRGCLLISSSKEKENTANGEKLEKTKCLLANSCIGECNSVDGDNAVHAVEFGSH